MKIAFLTLGCKLNYAETSTYEREFARRGLSPVPWEEGADVYLINTCSVTERAEKKCRNVIRKTHRQSPAATIIVTGCYAQLRREDIMGIEGVSLVFGAKEKSMVVDRTMEFLRGGCAGVPSVSAAENLSAQVSPATAAEIISGQTQDNLSEQAGPSHDIQSARPARTNAEEYRSISKDTMLAFSTEERTRSFLKVQDGCNNFCAYCTVPYARGNSRNIPIAEVVAQAEKIAETGVKEIVITGVNTGDFGRTTGESFLDLLRRLNEVQGIERYRISSIEPNLLTEEIIDWIASGTKFQPHFHIPLQTGSDALLRRVGRRYDTELFAQRIDYVRSVMDPRPGQPEGNLKPFVFFGIDVIAGLPGETDEMFEQTYSFLKDRIHPAYIHVFPYSKRPGTVAAAWKDQVKDSVKTERVARLEELCAALHSDFLRLNKGRHSEVLWESDVKDGLMGGYSGNYIRVERPYDPRLVNTVESVIL